MYDFRVLRELRRREGLTLKDVSDRAGVSVAVISRLERNQTLAELETLFRLGRVYGMSATDLLGLAERRTAHRTTETRHAMQGFEFRKVAYGNARCLHADVKAGSAISRPEVHQDDYEICWVLNGEVEIRLPNETHRLGGGEAVQFDAIFEHTYAALQDSEVVILHLTKGKRF